MHSVLALALVVGGGTAQPHGDATQVVVMRDGTRTVVSMEIAYDGPPEAFALIVPVPAALQPKDVKTLPADVFARVETLAAPRLVEYWEQDPCAPVLDDVKMSPRAAGAAVAAEAKFAVGEYQIEILSAKDSASLDSWLRREKYNLPEGTEALLRPYVATGMKFLVAKVDPAKVTFDHGKAVLSPLRFHYDADQLTLPIRLGLAKGGGTQDLIVNILAPDQRYQVANYPNVTIPTNIDVRPSVKDRFAAFYAALFDATLANHAGAIVTEYAWPATTCDPCPGPALDASDLATLGADVLPAKHDSSELVLTRLHARYGDDVKADLVFEPASPIAGGRELVATAGKLEDGAHPSTTNSFQARYTIRHPWSGPIRCNNPVHGRWGGPPPDLIAQAGVQHAAAKPALRVAAVPRGGLALADAVEHDVPEIGLKLGAPPPPPVPGSAAPPPPPEAKTNKKTRTGCGCESAGEPASFTLLGLFGLFAIRRRRHR
jgi:MYXO-CTERM domain-containing protein